MRVFTDASGDDRLIAAVMVVESKWKYTWTRVPNEILEAILPKDDCRIGVTEAMAFTLVLESFKAELEDNCVFCLVDSNVADRVCEGSDFYPVLESGIQI